MIYRYKKRPNIYFNVRNAICAIYLYSGNFSITVKSGGEESTTIKYQV